MAKFTVIASSFFLGVCITGLLAGILRKREEKRCQGYDSLKDSLPVSYEEFRKHFGELCRPVSFFVEKREDGSAAIGWILEDSNHKRSFVPALQVVKNFQDIQSFFSCPTPPTPPKEAA